MILLGCLLTFIFIDCLFGHEIIVEQIRKAAEALEVPGAAIGVVDSDGQILFSHCLGKLRLDDGENFVNDKSLFRIGSITKSLTTLMIANMVEQGMLNWDDILHDLLPRINSRGQNDEQVTLRESLGMSSGIPTKGLLLLFGLAKNGEERIDELNLIEPNCPKNSKFQYSNHMFAAGGYAAAHRYAPDRTLDEAYVLATKEMVFKPIGMDSSFVDGRDCDDQDQCYPHAVGSSGVVESLRLEDEYLLDSIKPAGSVLTNLADMLKYAAHELKSSSARTLERLEKHISISEELDYGLGVVVRRHPKFGLMHGHRGGSIGFSASVLFSKQLGFGIVTLTNKVESGDFMNIVDDLLFEYFSTWKVSNVASDISRNAVLRAELVRKMLVELGKTIPFVTPIRSWFISDTLGLAWVDISASRGHLKIDLIESRLALVERKSSKMRYRLVDSWACLQEIYIEIDDTSMVLADPHDVYAFGLCDLVSEIWNAK